MAKTMGRISRVLSPNLRALGLLAVFGAWLLPDTAESAPNVVVSVKPVHSLVAGVMTGTGTPTLLVKGAGSPHIYSLRPSEARAIDRADLIFWVGEELESFLVKPLEALGSDSQVIELTGSEGVLLLEAREGGAWDSHEEHAEHGHAEDEEHAEHENEAHDHGDHDLHIWLDPQNAKAIVRAAEKALRKLDPENAETYARNARAMTEKVEAMEARIAARLAPVKDRPYVVFHDAYQYFERHFGTNAVGSITVSPDRKPGAKRLTEIRRKLASLGAVCLFSEPQFEPAIVETLIAGTSARTGILDPLGADLEPGEQAYFELMDGIAKSLRSCLSTSS